MKQIFTCIGLAVAMLYGIGCERNIFVKKESEPTYFSTQQEAANKGKSDLLAVLRSRKEITLGLEEQTIEKSQPAPPIIQYQITFEDLLSADTFATLNRNELATVVPLVADDTVATIVEVAKDESGWKVVSLADKSLSSELDVVRKAAGPQAGIIIYDLPHSGSKVYGITQPAGAEPSATLFYTSYTGFNLREAVPAERLLPVLKQDAAEFQRIYGEELKQRKLVR
jgi:hypothetical protein